ncbi:CIA30 family protein [Prochlorococcus sp. MIT 0916]|uniref:CIA30 family protein n=1 Tax=Prochlorococcus sp. MIT 0916 TaxID=3082521 RepID=UPI0039B4411D
MPEISKVVSSSDFDDWFSLNDTVMGGSSKAACRASSKGLSLEGVVVEEKGGFVSCKSPIFSPILNLSNYQGFELKIEGKGRTLKFGVSCKYEVFSLREFFLDKSPGGLRWVAEIETKRFGTTTIKVPFESLEPTVLAKKISLPIKFKSDAINQFQLLHSKFGRPGELNPGFKPGKINFVLQSISVY